MLKHISGGKTGKRLPGSPALLLLVVALLCWWLLAVLLLLWLSGGGLFSFLIFLFFVLGVASPLLAYNVLLIAYCSSIAIYI